MKRYKSTLFKKIKEAEENKTQDSIDALISMEKIATKE